MSHRPASPRDDQCRELLGEWNFGGLERQEPELDDSLLAPPAPPRRARPESRPDPVRPTRGIPVPHIMPPPVPPVRLEDSARPLYHDFAFGQDDGAEADSLLVPDEGPERVSGPKRLGISPAVNPDVSLSTLKAGDTLSGFFLLSELGRGAFARVFLAEQVELGDRRVALKVSRAEGDEPQMLARLQHAHIVPIHSLHDDEATGLRLLCMPYLGGANLAQVLETAVGRSAPETNRLSLVNALDEVSLRFQAGVERSQNRLNVPKKAGSLPWAEGRASLPAPPLESSLPSSSSSVLFGSQRRFQAFWKRLLRREAANAGQPLPALDRDFDQPARRFLRQADTVRAAVWIVARLAEGLEHAHSRGLLHRDLKPSNILIAGDGTPMLLDFNLSSSTGPDDPGEGQKAMLGGTLPYMSPEHLAAFDPRETIEAEAVDERSDLYSLGLILFEIVAGEHPFPEPPLGTPLMEVITLMAAQRQRIPSARAVNPLVPWSLESIVRKCLDPEPSRRHARARDLAEDLKRFLEDLPLKHAPELSVRERAAKWLRRNPRVCNSSSIASMAIVLMIALGGLIGLLANNMQTLSARLKLRVLRTEADECRFLLNHSSGPTEHLEGGLGRASTTRTLIGLSAQGTLPPNSWAFRLEPREVEEVRAIVSELILLETRARVDLAGKQGGEEDRRSAIEWAVSWLDAAERIDPAPPAALFEDRARYQSALGHADQSRRDRQTAAKRTPTSSRDFLLLGSARLARGDLVQAEEALARASDLNPRSFWAWFTLGLCHLEAGRYADASGDFAASIAIKPSFAWPYLNRGLALARSGRLEAARRSYDLALKANPRFAEAWLNLALVTLELNDLDTADKALQAAVTLGRKEPAILAAIAEVQARRGDPVAAGRVFDRLIAEHPADPRWIAARGISRVSRDPKGARTDLEQALKIDGHHGRAKYGLALLLRRADPAKALGLVDSALSDEPGLIDALQLRALLRARLGDLQGVDDAERLLQVPTPHRLYNAACVYALLADSANEPRLQGRALGALDRALKAGFPASHAAADPDLNGLHALSHFRQLFEKFPIATTP